MVAAHPDVAQDNRAVVRRFYEELCDGSRHELVNELLSDTLQFRTSLGAIISGREAFAGYLRNLYTAFPDFHHRIDELLAVDDRVVARITSTGTQLGRFRDLEPTGASVEYVGAGFFRLTDRVIDEAWVVADTAQLWRALGRG